MNALLNLQRALADLVFDEDDRGFRIDPAGFAAARGLPPMDQAAFLRQRERFMHYRLAVRAGLWEPMERWLPLTRALLEESGAWEACRAAFLAARAVESPHYRDLAPTFLGWLEASGWGRDPWPFLTQLVHYELVDLLVERVQAPPRPPGLALAAGPGDRVALAAPTQVLAYAWRVIEATLDHPEPAPGPCHLLAFRGADGSTRWRELTPGTAALLVRSQDRPIAEAVGELGLADLDAALGLLDELCGSGAVLGFRPA